MTVPHVRHVIVGVDILPPDVVVEILHPAALDFDRRAIRDAQVSAERMPASSDRRYAVGRRRWKSFRRHPDDQVRIGRKAPPHRALGRRRDTGKVGVPPEAVGDDLEMQVRRPTDVLVRCSQRGEALAAGDALSDRDSIE